MAQVFEGIVVPEIYRVINTRDSVSDSSANYFRFLCDFMREFPRVRDVMVVFTFHGGSQ